MSNVVLVHGPPGTGKTRYLSHQAQRAADKHGASNVAIASLTRTAAHEIASRTPGIPEENVGTLHAHAYRALDRPELAETPEAIRDFNQAHPALELSGGAPQIEDAPPDLDGQQRTRGDELHAAVMNHRARLTPPSAWTEEERDYHQLWDDYKTQTGRADFTDLIEQAADLTPPAGARVLLLDEAQDFSRLELALAMRWAGHTDTTVIVGDTDQALYAWRGSDADALLQLPVAGTRVLEQSYRVPHAVHDIATRWIRQITGRPDVAYRPTDQPGRARRDNHTLRYPEPLVAEVLDDTTAGRSVMLLTSCGYMLAPLLHALRAAGVPFHNPHRVKQGAWNPLRAANRLLAYLRPDDRVWGGQARSWTWDDLRLWTDPVKAAGTLTRGAKTFIEEKCRPDRFGESEADQEAPLETVIELLAGGSLNHPAMRTDVGWWQENLLSSQAKMLAYPIDVYRARGGRALIDKPSVTVGTIHSVKGGEADRVYVFPDLSKQGYWYGWHAEQAARDQIIRMMYVAITRARETVTILDPSGPEHIPLDLLTPAIEAVA